MAINKFAQARLKYPTDEKNLRGWLQILSRGDFNSEVSLRLAFGDIRGFEHQFSFHIPDSTLIVHTYINFDTQVALIDEIKSGNQ